MILLSIETATSVCSVALQSDDKVLAEASQRAERRHNEVLPDMVLKLFTEAGLKHSDTEFVAVSIGPGSFTGLRVGLSFAKGWAMATGAKIVPVGTLEALAHAIITNSAISRQPSAISNQKSAIILAMTVARKGEAFGQKCRVQYEECGVEGEPFLCERDALAENLSDLARENSQSAIIFGGEGADALGGSVIALSHHDKVQYIADVHASAVSVGRMASRSISSGYIPLPAAELEPRYLKEFTIK